MHLYFVTAHEAIRRFNEYLYLSHLMEVFSLSTEVKNYILFTVRRCWKVYVCVYIQPECAVCTGVMFDNHYNNFPGVHFSNMAR